MNAELVKSTASALKSKGLYKLGYNYVLIDAGWQSAQREPNGTLQPNITKFPSGMKAVSDYVHGLGLKIGIYRYGRQITTIR